MKTDVLPIPGIVLGAYPERRSSAEMAAGTLARVRALLPARTGHRRYRGFIERTAVLDAQLGALDAAAITARLRPLRAAMARDGMTDALIAEAFVLVKRTCARVLGVDLFETQLLAARIMLDRQLAEMATGEGKTLAAGVCAATAALAGIPVHVITANEYLVDRDAAFLTPLYDALGVSAGTVTQSLPREARLRAYDCDIVYCTASELAFDYLRDGLVRDRSRSDLHQRVATLRAGAAGTARATLLRGLCMAIIDEADSVLIDEARVPLILSESCANQAERDYLNGALQLALRLTAEQDFVLHPLTRSVELTSGGRTALERLAESLAAVWHNRMHREETVGTALAALHLYERDRDYLVRDGVVTIIDGSTGRVAPGRVWSKGLHRLIEIKEGCEPTGETVTVAQITFQRFFQRYLALCGMSGTLAEARLELGSTYSLPVVPVPLRCPDRRIVLPTRFFRDRDTQWDAVVAEIRRMSGRGRPVLVGTGSVAESEALSQRLIQENLPHAVLNARQDSAEAHVIARAGEAGQITVATNMAGRGTDIVLPPAVAACGGLHVICCQHNASGRIDRQLLGRCARRGEPGSTQTLLALDQPLIGRWVPGWVVRRIGGDGCERPQWMVQGLVRFAQQVEERRERALRRELLRRDTRAIRSLSFGRPTE